MPQPPQTAAASPEVAALPFSQLLRGSARSPLEPLRKRNHPEGLPRSLIREPGPAGSRCWTARLLTNVQYKKRGWGHRGAWSSYYSFSE